jgi:hypothetical protein
LGLLQKLFGGSSDKGGKAAPARPVDGKVPLPPQPRGRPVVIPPTAGRSQQVTGVSHHQAGFGRRPPGPVRLELRCQPDNPFDRNAVGVILDGGGQVGYLSAHMAADYQPILRRLEAEGPVYVDGIIENWEGGRGVQLALPGHERLAVWANTPPDQRGQVGLETKRVRLKRLGNYQDALNQVLAGRSAAQVGARVTAFETPSGKYKGQPSLRFSVDGIDIGLLPAQYTDEAPTLFAWLAPGGAERVPVRITRFPEGNVGAMFEYVPPAEP